MRRLLLGLLLTACSTSAAWAQASPLPDVISAQVEPNDRSLIIVTFDTPVPASDVMRTAAWQATLFTKLQARDASVARVGIVTCSDTVFTVLVNRCPVGEAVEELALQMFAPVSADVSEVEVRLTSAAGLKTGRFAQTGPPTAAAGFSAAKTDDADIGFDGSLAKTVGAPGEYNIDLFAGYMRALFRRPQGKKGGAYLGRIGFYGEAKTKESLTADPSSFLVYGVYSRELGRGGFRGPFQTPVLNVRVPGVEFDKTRGQTNFLVSPTVTLPIRLTAGRLGVIAPGATIPHVTVTVGTEIVNSLQSDLGVTGWRARGLGGLTFRTGYAPETPWLHSILLTSSYVVRVLSDPEPYQDPGHAPIDPETGEKGKAPFELGAQARHKVELEFRYNPVKSLGLTIKYEYGSLPPVYSITDSTFTVGLAFAFRQTSYGRYAILRP